eukprot:TRINITY_DN1803_c0_g3_i1.p1 TRINITY_DN1803_c0_g3~~TRINITY_DN1803_c0_g3_i1.p1  ORF type:complete len:112 (+),score=21.68 TRINITY_DN1803_c0_g3_i1:339-674(+)
MNAILAEVHVSVIQIFLDRICSLVALEVDHTTARTLVQNMKIASELAAEAHGDPIFLDEPQQQTAEKRKKWRKEAVQTLGAPICVVRKRTRKVKKQCKKRLSRIFKPEDAQ